MTGAVLPFGADCVVPVEDCTVRGNTLELRPGAVAVPGKYIHACGLDYARGDLVLAAGARLHPAHLALAASEGHRHLLVNADIRVQVITTGDEVIEAGSEPMPGRFSAPTRQPSRLRFRPPQTSSFMRGMCPTPSRTSSKRLAPAAKGRCAHPLWRNVERREGLRD